MRPRRSDKTLVIGYGNDLRRDDGAGPMVVKLVEDQSAGSLRTFSPHQLGPEFAEDIAAAAIVIFVDAVRIDSEAIGAKPQVRRLYPAVGAGSAIGHSADPAGLMLLSHDLYGRCPKAWLVTVPGFDFDYGEGLSDVTMAAVPEAAAIVWAIAARSEFRRRRCRPNALDARRGCNKRRSDRDAGASRERALVGTL